MKEGNTNNVTKADTKKEQIGIATAEDCWGVCCINM